MFDYDWFHGAGFQELQNEARWRCAMKRFTHLPPEEAEHNEEFNRFAQELELRTLVYLRDGFSYELKELTQMSGKARLSFECEPVDDHYKVGSFVVSVPFDEVVRVEVFAVHPSEKPEDMPLITGFRNQPERSKPSA